MIVNKGRKQKRTYSSIRSCLDKNLRYRFRNFINSLAILMVLFLSFLAVIVFINSAMEDSHGIPDINLSDASQTLTPTPPSQTPTSPPTTQTVTPSPVPSKVTPSPSPIPATVKPAPPVEITAPVSSSIFSATRQNPTNRPVITPLPDASPISSISTTPTPRPSINEIRVPLPTTQPSPKPLPTPTITTTEIPSPTKTAKSPNNASKATSYFEKEAVKALVVVDPGHGGIDPGTCSIYKEGFYEKDINLDIGLKLRTFLENSGVSVIMTRETDTEVYKSAIYNYNENVRERPRIANNNNAALFISIHVNAYDTKLLGGENYNGTEIYYFGRTHGDYTDKQFAAMMGQAVDIKTDTKYNGTRKKDLGVLRLARMPALLIETAYLTNKKDHERLESNEFRTAMSEGIHDGIIEILKTMGAFQ